MGTKSKLFRAFVEGNTISDGRVITAAMIDEIVETHNPEVYSPRINVEHLTGYSPEPPFNGYGDVVAVEARDDEFTIAGKTEKRRALYCQVDGNDQLVGLVAKNQKPYPSVELTDSYAGSGKVGLIGLAFTDTPASIGTQALKFSRSTPGSYFAPSADAVTIEFEEAPAAETSKVASAVTGFFSALTAKFTPAEPEKPKEEPKPKAANDNAFDIGAFTSELQTAVAGSIAAALKPVTDAHAALQGEFATIKGKLTTTEEPRFSRNPAPGGTGDLVTDC